MDINMGEQKKVVKFKKRRGINIGIVVFLILFIYLLINVYLYFTKEKLSIYEVHEGTTAIDNHITGIILRSEKVIHSQKAGYVTYYQKEGARVAKNTAVYSVDDSGQLYTFINDSDVPITLSDKNYNEIKHDITNFQNSFSDDNFSSVYTFKENAQSTVLDILNDTVITQGQTIMANTGLTYSYDMIPSDESGVVSYYTDSYEDLTPETITKDMFSQENYQRTSLRKTDILPLDSPIYKLITSETWSIVIPLTKAQYDLISDRDKISFKVLDDNFEMTAAIKFLPPDKDTYYAQLTMNKYLSNYLEDRFLDIELNFNAVDGLKIPTSAIVEKDFYIVPLEYFAEGSDSKELGLTKKTYSANGDITYNHVTTDIYYQDDTDAYVDTNSFAPGTIIQLPVPPTDGSSVEYTLSQTAKLTGVYNVNLGYSVFKRIDILTRNDDYCIVGKDTPYGLSAYDHIALDGSKVVDQAIIY